MKQFLNSILDGLTFRDLAGPVIYVLFFALVGARLQVSLLPAMGAIGIAYLLVRSLAKYSGAWLGGFLGRAEPNVRNYLGFGLLSQAGVAIGLALSCSERVIDCGQEGADIAALVLGAVTATTFVAQLIGPIFVKFAVTRAGEIGQAIQEEDIWASEGSPKTRS